MNYEDLNPQQQEFFDLLKYGSYTIEANLNGALKEAESMADFLETAVQDVQSLIYDAQRVRDQLFVLFG